MTTCNLKEITGDELIEDYHQSQVLCSFTKLFRFFELIVFGVTSCNFTDLATFLFLVVWDRDMKSKKQLIITLNFNKEMA